MTAKETSDKVIAKIESTLSRPLTDLEKTLVEFTTNQIVLDLLDY